MIEIVNADCRTLTNIASCDVLITDPPYSERVHRDAISQFARGGTRHRDLGFDPLSDELRAFIAQAAASVKRWGIIYSDVESSTAMANACEAYGAEYIRTMAWVRWSMPQLSGDRPPQGFEHLVVTWGSQSGRKSWNGPGNLTHLAHGCLRGDGKHKAEKPLDQALDLVSWFTRPYDMVLDLFAGSGTIPLACALLGRHCIATELDPEWAERAQARVAGPLQHRDRERVERWLNSPCEPVSAQSTGPSVERAKAREADREFVRDMVGK